MLACIELLRTARSPGELRDLTTLLLHRFVALRDASRVRLARIARLSLDQQRGLVGLLLDTPSGGLLPVLLAVALFRTLDKCHALGWDIEWQGINVADHASGAGGDITIRKDGEILLAVEVTERTVERARIVSTFNTKISRHGIRDYLFLVTREPPDDAKEAAGQYFGQGHDVNFLDIGTWITQILGTIGADCRQRFTTTFLDLLDQRTVPAALKVRWNTLVQALVT
ncbi:MAG: restriction endonuclease, SacI family [Rubellimicrobium sp.]|nr:restriction endonuclease, SacI family [Rubellimicrobium sp.]